MSAERETQDGDKEHVPATPDTASLPMEEAGEEEAARQQQQVSQTQVTDPSAEEASVGPSSHQNPMDTLVELMTLNGKPGLTVRTRGSHVGHVGPALVFPSQGSLASKDSSRSSTPALSSRPSPPARSPPVSPFVSTTLGAVFPQPRGQSHPVPMDRLPSLQDGMGSCGASGMLSSYVSQRQPSLSDWVMHSGGGSGSLSSASSGLFDRAGLPYHPLQGDSGGSPIPCVAPQLWLKAGWNFGAGGVAYRSPTVSDEVVSPALGAPLLPQNPRAKSHLAASARDEAAGGISDSPPQSKGPDFLSTPSWSAPSTPRLPFSPEESPGAVPGPAREVPGILADGKRVGHESLPDRQQASTEMYLIAEALSSACINTLEARLPPTGMPGPVSPHRDRSPAPKRCRSPAEKTSPATPGGAADYMRAKSPRLELRPLVPPLGGPGALSRSFVE